MKYVIPGLETERLILKRGNLEDYLKVYEYDFTKLMDIDGEFTFTKLDPNVVKNFVPESDECDILDWIIYLDDKTPIGNLLADRYVEELNSLELAFNLHSNYWGKGYMKEAIICAMDYLYKLGFDNVLCSHYEGNEKSKRVIEKVGFEFLSKKENSWNKNGKFIASYTYIMSKELFYDKYYHKTK